MAAANDVDTADTTSDVTDEETTYSDDPTFAEMPLSEKTINALVALGHRRPTPVQRQAIPLGKCGFDLIIQDKRGTGKTTIFSIIAMEMYQPLVKEPQIIILSPTREVSYKIAEVMTSVCGGPDNINVACFLGGPPLNRDKKKITRSQIVVGAPVRIKHLIKENSVDLSKVKLFVLEEADRLMDHNFLGDISFIYSKLPLNKQMIAVSPTFPQALEDFVAEFMNKPIKISPSSDTVLIGVRQFVFPIRNPPDGICAREHKAEALLYILSRIPFKQCLVFTSSQNWAEIISNELSIKGWPSAFVSSGQNQVERLNVYKSLQENRCRVLLATDRTSQEIDFENVNLVVSLELPFDCASYIYRVRRAGRYGTHGIAIAILQEGEEIEKFRIMLYKLGGANFFVYKLPKSDLLMNVWKANTDQFEKLSSLLGEYKFVKTPDTADKQLKEGQKKLDPLWEPAILKSCRIAAPSNVRLETFESLEKELNAFKEERHGSDITRPLTFNILEDVTPIPEPVRATISYVVEDGLNSFYDRFTFLEKPAGLPKSVRKNAPPKNVVNDSVSPPCVEMGSDNCDGNSASGGTGAPLENGGKNVAPPEGALNDSVSPPCVEMGSDNSDGNLASGGMGAPPENGGKNEGA